MRYTSLVILLLLLIGFDSISQCLEDSHSSFQNQGWLSCQQSESAVKENGKQHWIQYDLGSVYTLKDVRIWNHNVWGETGQGAKSIKVDYSLDGSNWMAFGNLKIEEAPGSWKYIAPEPIELDGLTARYVLLTVLDTWEANSSCAGIAELRFGVEATTSIANSPVDAGQFTITPNPSSEVIQIDFPAYEKRDIRIVNSIGQTLRVIENVTQASLDISIVDLKEGIYYITINSENKLETNSFVKI